MTSRCKIQVDGLNITVVNSVRFVLNTNPNRPEVGGTFSRPVAQKWIAHLATKGVEATLVQLPPEGTSEFTEWCKAAAKKMRKL